MARRATFEAFAERKTQEAERAQISPLRTVEDCSGGRSLRAIGNAWTRRLYDGDFHLFEPPRHGPALSLVFVQSRDGNTGASNPDQLGGGATDKHLIYEGLSRVAADGVLAGATTAAGANVFFTVWHPELVSLRQHIGLPRHPAQIVMSNEGRLNLDARLFNVPEVPVFLLAAGQALEKFGNAFADRPWVTVIPLSDARPVDAFARLRNEYAVSRISVVGGRKTATALIDAGLVQDLYLTTAGREGGEPNTPFYTGRTPPRFDVIVRKHGIAAGSTIVFEHLAVDPHAPAV